MENGLDNGPKSADVTRQDNQARSSYRRSALEEASGQAPKPGETEGTSQERTANERVSSKRAAFQETSCSGTARKGDTIGNETK
jgi:hypothetical protein